MPGKVCVRRVASIVLLLGLTACGREPAERPSTGAGAQGNSPATAATVQANRAVAQGLPLADARDFDDARRGLVAAPDALAVRRADGRAIRLVGAVSDITREKEVQQALADSEERYARALEAVNESVYDWNLADGTIFYSPRILALFGKSREELRTPDLVDAAVARTGTTLIVVNSVCGCAAGKARPGIALALGRGVRPDHLGTVFAGGDIDATARAREHFAPYPPSSPSVALLKDGKLVYMMERRDIEMSPADVIAQRLQDAFAQHCS